MKHSNVKQSEAEDKGKELVLRDLEIEAVYDIAKDLLRLPVLQSKQGLCWRVAEHLHKLGYRKIPKDKPALLDNEEIKDWICSKDEHYHFPSSREIDREGQREADIKHYEGSDDNNNL